MSENKPPAEKKSFSVDWLVRGTLTRVGDIFDKLTGRSWKPSSSLATSELTERLKKLLDAEVRDMDKKGKFVPHNIKLKIQWDKFSTDSEDAMKKLEYELLTAVIDHINDNRYHTYAPLKFEIKPDYFVEGVKLHASFEEFVEEEDRDAELNVTVPNLKNIVIPTAEPVVFKPEKEVFVADFTFEGKSKRVELEFSPAERLSVGRTKENALSIPDQSVSKMHASLVLNPETGLMVADTGSTNGTFINDKRIAYGKAFPVASGDRVKFGTIEVLLTYVPKEVEEAAAEEEAPAPVPLSSTVATERMISQEDYLKKQFVTIAAESPLENKIGENVKESSPVLSPAVVPTPESSSDTISDAKTIAHEAAKAGAEKPEKEEEAPPVTEQRIVYDFGENK